MGKTEKNWKKITQLKWQKYQKPKDKNMGWKKQKNPGWIEIHKVYGPYVHDLSLVAS